MPYRKENKDTFTHEFTSGNRKCIAPWRVPEYIPRLVKLPNGHLLCCCGSTLSKMSQVPKHNTSIKHRLATGELGW